MRAHTANSDDDYLKYGIPPAAKKSDRFNSRDVGKKWVTYFLPNLEPSANSLIASETYDGERLIERALYKDGFKHGVQREWYRNGQLRTEAPYKNGVMHGTFRIWNELGHLIAQYEMMNGAGRVKIYSDNGELVRENQIENSVGNGLSMEVHARDSTRSLFWQKDGEVFGKSFGFCANGKLRHLICYSTDHIPHGPYISFSEEGISTEKKWFVDGSEVSESEYAVAAAKNPALPPYYEDAAKYREFTNGEVKALLEKYGNLPRVKIPLEFDKSGNPILAQQ